MSAESERRGEQREILNRLRSVVQKAKGKSSRFLRMMGVFRLVTIRFYKQQTDCMCVFFVICVVIRTSYIRYQIPYFNPEHSLFDIS